MTRDQASALNIGDEIFIIGAHRSAKCRAKYLGLKTTGAVVEYETPEGHKKRVVPLNRLMRNGDV